MNALPPARPRWSTTSFGDTTDTSPAELAVLSQHLGHCQAALGALFACQCAADAMRGFISARFVTTLTLAFCVLAGVGSLVH